ERPLPVVSDAGDRVPPGGAGVLLAGNGPAVPPKAAGGPVKTPGPHRPVPAASVAPGAGPGGTGPDHSAPLLEVQDLTVSFGKVRAVEGVSLSIGQGEGYRLVRESGWGKSTLAYSLLGLVPPPGRIVSGAVRFRGQDLAGMSYRELRRLR